MTSPRRPAGATPTATADRAPLPKDVPPHVDDARVIDGVDVDALVTAVTSCPSVSGMAAGGLGGAVTLLPGRRVPGVRVGDGEVRVDVRARWGATPAVLVREVRAATAPLLAGHRLHVVLADIDDPDPPMSTSAPLPDRHATPSPKELP